MLLQLLGLVGGDRYDHQGGGVNYLCLPSFLCLLEKCTALSMKSAVSIRLEKNLHDHEAPCVVCYVKSRGSTLMMPARNDCPSGWTEEYHGYLMSEAYSNKKQRDFICVDEDAEYVPGSQANKHGASLYLVQVDCIGMLPCLPYVKNRELTCAVCTK